MQVTNSGVQVDGQVIKSTVFYPDAAGSRAPAILFIHGWKSSQDEFAVVAERLCGIGFICLTFNLRGHDPGGEQFGEMSRADNLRDVLAAYDVLGSRPDVNKSKIAAVGVSYGGYLAAILTARRDLEWLALRVPALYKDTEFERPKEEINETQDIETYRREKLDPEDNEVLAVLSQFKGDVLIVESENDAVVPHQEIENYRQAFERANSLTHAVIRGADHGLSDERWQQKFVNLLSDWFRKRLEE